MINLDVDFVQVSSVVLSKIRSGLVARRHHQLYKQIAAVAEKYRDVFCEHTPVHVVNPESMSEAELRAHLYATDDSFIDAAISAIGVKFRPSIKACRDIMEGRFTYVAGRTLYQVPNEPSPIPLSLLPGAGKVSIYGIEQENPEFAKVFGQDIRVLCVEVEGEYTATCFPLNSIDRKDQFIMSCVIDLLKENKVKWSKIPENESDLGSDAALVKLTPTMRENLAHRCHEWDRDNPSYNSCVFWLDTNVQEIFLKESYKGIKRHLLSAIDTTRTVGSGKLWARNAILHMETYRPGIAVTAEAIRLYLKSNQSRNVVTLLGSRGFSIRPSDVVPTMDLEYSRSEKINDLQAKQDRVRRLLDEVGICQDAFDIWESRSRLYSIYLFEDCLRNYHKYLSSEIAKWNQIMDRELRFIEQTVSGRERRPNFAGSRKLQALLSDAKSRKRIFNERLKHAKSRLSFPEVNQRERKLPFERRKVDWYSEWLNDFINTNCVRKVHVKGKQLAPVVFEGQHEDLMALGDGRAVCIIVKRETAKYVTRFRTLVSHIATGYNVLYAAFILSRITSLERELPAVLEAGKEGLEMMVKSTNRFVREIVVSDMSVSVIQIEQRVDSLLPHLNMTERDAVTRTVIDLIMSGTATPQVEVKGNITSCYVDCVHEEKSERISSSGKLILDTLIPLAGTKVWSSVGESYLTATLINRPDAIRIKAQSEKRYYMYSDGRYLPPKDNEFIADVSIKCG